MPFYKYRDDLRNLMLESYGHGRRFTVIYDGYCGICRNSVWFLRKVDVLHNFQFVKLQEIPSLSGGKIPVELLQDSIHVVDNRNGRVSTEMNAIMRLLLHAPPAFPVFFVACILKAAGISDPVYSWISRSRFRLSEIFSS